MTLFRLYRSLIFGILTVCCLRSTVWAQDSLLKPSEFLGYELGTRFTPHNRLMDYIEHVAANSPNVIAERYGVTYEDRPLVLLFVSSSDNISNLEEIRLNNLRMTGLLDGNVTETTAAIVWLSYNVHGNEAVSSEAAMATLYDLADLTNSEKQGWLENTVVIIDPCVNPDGRDRYVHWYNRTVGSVSNPMPEAREHNEPWPGGRSNHYYFDLNRDWAWMTQKETRLRLYVYNRWMPHVHADFHEQGVDAPYYFAPAAEPYHEDITEWQRSFQTTIGKNHARHFDNQHWLYFTRQVFDLYYPGYGDTWPTYNGSVGMTYEQGGSGRAGLGIITSEGDTLTLSDRIAHHYTTGLSTVEITAENAPAVVEAFQTYFAEATTNPTGTYKTFVIKKGEDPDKLKSLVNHLAGQGIRFGFASERRSIRGFDYRAGQTGTASIDPGDMIVSAYQPKSVLTKILFEPRSMPNDSVTYDITAWSLPYAYGLDAYALEERVNPDTDIMPQSTLPDMEIDHPYAYLAEWKSLDDLRFLSAVLQEKVKLRFADKQFVIGGRTFDPGTLILTRAGNEHLNDRFDQIVQETASSLQQPLFPVSSGYVESGADFGSRDVPYLERPLVAMLSDDGVSSGSVGQVWHFFDEKIQYPITLIEAGSFSVDAIKDYNVLILPHGSYDRVLTEARLDDLKTWIRGGGRLIVFEGALSALAGKEGFSLKQTSEEPPADSLEQRLRKYGDQRRENVTQTVAGSIYQVQLDNTHPLGYGYPDYYYTLKRSNRTFEFLKDGWNVGVIRKDGYMSGFAGFKARERLEDTLVFGIQDMGRGKIVYFVDDPIFRGFWHNGYMLLGNAIFLVGQ